MTDNPRDLIREELPTAADMLEMQAKNSAEKANRLAKKRRRGWHPEGTATIPLVTAKRTSGSVQTMPRDMAAGFSTAGYDKKFGDPAKVLERNEERQGE